MAAGEIASNLDLPPSSLSFHLAHLSRAHLIQCVRKSRQLIYYADYAQMNILIAYLMENCCSGDFVPDLKTDIDADITDDVDVPR